MESLSFKGWLPIRIWQEQQQWWVDWCWFGQQHLHQPFFRDEVDDALRLPFNQALRRVTPLSALSDWQQASPGLAPTAFIHHASRCGSTLIGQMLARLDTHIVMSEPPPLDTLLRSVMPARQREAAIQGLLSAYGQVRSGRETALVIKLDAWNIVEFALLHGSFPDVPWLYLYRDPLEIAVSHLRRAGMHMVPGMLGAAHLDGTQPFVSCEDDMARRLGLLLQAGLQHCAASGGLALNYSELPQAMGGRLAAMFGLDEAAIGRAFTAIGVHAKAPSQAFVADGQAKQREASPLLRERIEYWASAAYAGLEALRLSAQAQPLLEDQ